MRVIENLLIMIVITIFAFYQFDCQYCADSEQRQAWKAWNNDEEGNKRIFVWIINGWISIIIHLITSLLMIKLVDDDYDFNVATIAEEFYNKIKKEKEQNAKKAQQRIEDKEL